MNKVYEIHYNDGAYYGTLTFNDMSQGEIEVAIQSEINSNNENINLMYHISRDNFKEIA